MVKRHLKFQVLSIFEPGSELTCSRYRENELLVFTSTGFLHPKQYTLIVYTTTACNDSHVINLCSTAPSDFTLLNNTLQFPSGSSADDVICAMIAIIEDVIVEHNETFTVSLSTENRNDMITPNATLLTITDDDGTYVDVI